MSGDMKLTKSKMLTLAFDLVDVFAVRPLEGNLLAVIHDADAVGDGACSVSRPASAYPRPRSSRLRPSLPPTTDIGSSRSPRRSRSLAIRRWALRPPSSDAAAANGARRRGHRTETVVQQTGEGLQRLDVELDGDRARVALEQSPATFGVEIPTASLMAGSGWPLMTREQSCRRSSCRPAYRRS